MATPLEQMVIEIKADTGNLHAEMTKVKAQLEQVGTTAKRESDSAKTFGSALKGVAAAAAGLLAVREVVSFISESGKAAVSDSKSQKLLERQLVATTNATASQVGQAEKSIAAMEQMSAVADDDIRPAFAQLTRATGDVGKATELTRLALNVSAGTGKELSAVTIALGKAYQGNTAGLAKLGLNVKGLKDPMGELQKQFANAAQTAANADPYQRLSYAMDKIRESVGTAMLPVLEKFAQWLVSVVPQIEAFFTALNDPTTELGSRFEALGNFIAGAFTYITKNISTIIGLATAFGIAATAITVVQGAMSAYAAITGAAAVAQGLFDVAIGAFNPVALAIGAAVLGVAIGGIAIAGYNAADAINKMSTAAAQADKATTLDPSVVLTARITAQTEAAQKTGRAYKDVAKLVEGYNSAMAGTQFDRGTWLSNATQQDKNIISYIANRKGQLVSKAQKELNAAAAQSARESAGNAATNSGVDLSPVNATLTAAQKAAKTAASSDAKTKMDAAKAHAKKLADIAKKHNDDIAKQQADLADRLKTIVNNSLQSLRDAFASAASVDIGAMFTAMKEKGDSSAEGLLASLKDKLAKIQQLAKDTAALAGAGFSELFIQQVVAQGPEVGDAMAQSILGASAQTKKELKDTFAATVQLGTGSFIGGSTTNLTSDQLLALGSTTNGQNVVGASSQVTINAPVSVQTNASPAQIAQATASAIRFGIPLGVYAQ
jgi:hypothetical protein